jgi:hypothetical protein
MGQWDGWERWVGLVEKNRGERVGKGYGWVDERGRQCAWQRRWNMTEEQA